MEHFDRSRGGSFRVDGDSCSSPGEVTMLEHTINPGEEGWEGNAEKKEEGSSASASGSVSDSAQATDSFTVAQSADDQD